MNNEEKLNQQLSDMADIIKSMFTEEELKQMEESFNVFKERMLKEKENKEQ